MRGLAEGLSIPWDFPFCRGRILNVTEEDRGQYDEVREVFWCSGAALCIRRESYLQAGGLDERFFAHHGRNRFVLADTESRLCIEGTAGFSRLSLGRRFFAHESSPEAIPELP